MPFPVVSGLPESTSQTRLRQLRKLIIQATATSMGVSSDIVRPFFPKDLAGDPDHDEDTTIYCQLDTGMFNRSSVVEFFATIARFFGWYDPLHEKRERTTSSVAFAIWNFFQGQYEVEVFIGSLMTRGKTHLKPKR